MLAANTIFSQWGPALLICFTVILGVFYQNGRINDLGRRLDDLNRRIDDLKGSMDRRIDDLKGSIDKRFDDLKDYIKSEFSVWTSGSTGWKAHSWPIGTSAFDLPDLDHWLGPSEQAH